ncbi:hypothetical protein BS47DRAFT_1357796 [Hydnum rufescens UP504]|uniref:Uncharacterized protein n=1 Tax=Hydnum rufescens UP504 TaxID=1448309 RepID=A0A9P6E2D2_9AGAM|nr:hypothetical protein BS47DRAFT_1357796 [Hydnum rufescens UP504]
MALDRRELWYMENNNHLVEIEKKALYEELQEEDYYIKYKKLAPLDCQELWYMENNNHLVGIEKKALYEELQEEDYYIKYKKLTCHLEILNLQESYIKEEQANLKQLWYMENNNHLVGIEKKALYEELQEEDYIKYKKLAHHLEMVNLQESYIKDEQANLKREPIWAQEVKCIQSVPLEISQFLKPIDYLTGIVGINNWLKLCCLYSFHS